MTSLQDDQPTLNVGDMAPDFTLPTHSEGELNLAWYRTRKHVVLAFYPADWTPVCATQIPGYKPLEDTLEQCDTQLLGISVDSVFSHTAWARSLGGLFFPLMADYFPHGAVARKYGVLHPKGFANRSVFLIDKAGVIRYIERMEPAGLPDNEALLAAIKSVAGELP
jgi:alkyl hydroperoxide reductase subunit AhpC